MVKKGLALLLVFCLLVPLLTGAAVNASTDDAAPERYIIGLTAPLSDLSPLEQSESCFPLDHQGTMFSVTDARLFSSLVPAEQISFIEPDSPIQAAGLTNDSYSDELWHLPFLQADTAWNLGLDGSGVRVAILDSGIRADHEDFDGVNLLPGRDYTGSGSTNDSTGHGTFVAGLIAARRNNGVGVAGLTDRATLVPLKVLNNGNGSTSSLISAVYDAIDVYHCDVLNFSLGSKSYSAAERTAIDYAVRHGALVVASVGNDGVSQFYYPAALENTVGVGYIDSSGTVAAGSQRNSSVDVVAPGYRVASTGYENTSSYRIGSGSSFSAPMVSAMAVMAKQLYPQLTQSVFSDLLTTTATDAGDSGYDTSYGWGIVNLPAFLSAVASYADTASVLSNFSDVQQHWARDAIAQAVSSGLLNGMSATRFAPDETTTRAMAVTVLARMSGQDLSTYPAVFSDVSAGSWYAPSVNWAAATGIAQGHSAQLFAPEETLTREQLAAFLYRYAVRSGAQPPSGDSLDRFSDASAVSAWAHEPVNWAVENQILQGSAGRLNPRESATRAQLAAMLVRLQSLLDVS